MKRIEEKELVREEKSLMEHIKELPVRVKVTVCVYIVVEGFNNLYDFGYVIGECLRTIL